MAKYALIYYGEPHAENAEDGRARFQQWLEGLGDAVVNPGMPLGPAQKVSTNGVTDNGGSDRLTGLSIVNAESMDAAIEMAKACPFLEVGTVDVAQIFEM